MQQYIKTLSKVLFCHLQSLPIVYSREFLDKNFVSVKPHTRKQYQKVIELINKENALVKNKVLYPTDWEFDKFKLWVTQYTDLFRDSIHAASRASQGINKHFSQKKSEFDELPDYYLRNFHFQTDGYLSPKSADLYEQQTEILFGGTLQIMRRVLLSELLVKIKKLNRPVKILELGSGTGEAAEILLKSGLPIELTVSDLSHHYLEKAKTRLAPFKHVSFRLAEATQLEVEKNSFDFVLTAYLFHELPKEERIKIIKHSDKQYLKPKGIQIHLDSIQWDDDPLFNESLSSFPKNFHEPFYTNYIKTPFENLIPGNLKVTFKQLALLSKIVFIEKKVKNATS
jgi:ubiquinone/menaquinone biosynthesis C-methylase UbiE